MKNTFPKRNWWVRFFDRRQTERRIKLFTQEGRDIKGPLFDHPFPEQRAIELNVYGNYLIKHRCCRTAFRRGFVYAAYGRNTPREHLMHPESYDAKRFDDGRKTFLEYCNR